MIRSTFARYPGWKSVFGGRTALLCGIFFILCGLTPLYAAVQAPSSGTVRGIVTDSQTGQAILGAAVVVPGTARGTTTGIDGEYSLNIEAGDNMLSASVLGYATKQQPYSGQGVVNFSLDPQSIAMDDVVVVGYGVQKKSDVTGAVASVPSERINTPGNVSVTQALQGAVPGITILSTSGGADPSNSTILVRGRKSISASNDPLIVVDGVPYAGELSDISPNDIQSIEVLKDASSAAIYGSRGSNGVILITTKQGTEGKVRISYEGYYSLTTTSNFPTLMGPEEYYEYSNLRKEAGYSGSLDPNEEDNYAAGLSTNWKDVLLRNGSGQNHRVSISGGNQNTKYMVSANFLDNKGVALNDKYKRAGGRVNLTTTIRPWLKFGTNTTFSVVNADGTSVSLNQLFQTSPLAQAYNDDGSVNIDIYSNDTKYRNPLEWTLYESTDRRQQFATNNYLDIEIPYVKGLSYRINTGLTYRWNEATSYWPSYTRGGSDPGNEVSSLMHFYYNNWTLENIVNYNRSFGKHTVFLTGLYSFEQTVGRYSKVTGAGFSNDDLGYYGMATAQLIKIGFETGSGHRNTYESGMISQMFRANYSYDSRYLFTFTIRRDGYSGFSENKKWGVFPSVALGWNISREAFMESMTSTVSQLKLRASYGHNGNQAIRPYESIPEASMKGTVDDKGNLLVGYLVSSLGNPFLGWENTKSFNIGLDYGFLNNRISGSVEYYNSKTTDLLLLRSISLIHGSTSMMQNIGKTRNSGVEFFINSTNIQKPAFSWTTSFNIAFNKNKILDLYGDGKDDINNKWFIGKPLDANYGYKFLGIWQEWEADEAAKYGAKPGYAKYEDIARVDDNGNETTVIDEKDRVFQGSSTPKVTAGLSNTFTYKDFRLSFFLYGAFGARRANYLMDSKYLISRKWWTPENASTSYWSMDPLATQYCSGSQTEIFEKTDFVRLKDLTLSYSLPQNLLQKSGIDNVSVFFTGKNLFTITGYNGFDPEFSQNQVIPAQRQFIFGLNFTF